MPVLLFSVPASATKHGDPMVVAYEGNCKSGDTKSNVCSEGQQQYVHDVIQGNCEDIGAQSWSPLTGGFDGGEYHFKYLCYCAHGNTGLPFEIKENLFDAQATYYSQCN
jgi:hypothetical protein